MVDEVHPGSNDDPTEDPIEVARQRDIAVVEEGDWHQHELIEQDLLNSNPKQEVDWKREQALQSDLYCMKSQGQSHFEMICVVMQRMEPPEPWNLVGKYVKGVPPEIEKDKRSKHQQEGEGGGFRKEASCLMQQTEIGLLGEVRHE